MKRSIAFESETKIAGVELKVNGAGRLFVIDEERTVEALFGERISRKTRKGEVFISLLSKSVSKRAVTVEIRENENHLTRRERRRRQQRRRRIAH